MICVETIGKIRRWHRIEKLSISQIARRLGASHNTVKRYLKAAPNELPARVVWGWAAAVCRIRLRKLAARSGVPGRLNLDQHLQRIRAAGHLIDGLIPPP